MRRPENDDVLDAIYEAATEPQLWSRALEKFGERFGGASILTGCQEVKPLFSAAARYDDDLYRLFLAQYTNPSSNPTIEFFLKFPVGQPFDIVGLIGRERFVRSDFYRDTMEPLKLWPLAGAVLFREGGHIAPLGIARQQGSDAPGAGEIEELCFWFKHLARAMRVTARIVKQDWERQGLRATLDQLRLGVVLIAPNGKIALLNAAAEQMARTRDGIHAVGGRLVAARSDESSVLSRLIAAACSREKRGGGIMAVSRPSGAPAYGVEVASLSHQRELGSVAAVFISDPLSRAQSSIEQLCNVLGLAPAEARIALKLAEGLALTDAANELGISLNTAKTLLQRAFAKTQTRRQGQLVRLMNSTLPELRD